MTAPADVVLLHGVGLNHTMWHRVAPDVTTAGHRVHAPDLLGHGAAPDAAAGTTLTDLAEPVVRIAAGAPAPVHLVGFSLGALVATRVALDHPERVASLTLVSGVANRSESERQAVAGRLEKARQDLASAFEAAVDRWFSPRGRNAEPELVDQIRTVLRANRPPSYLACYAVFAHADAELWPELSRMVPPVLAITGEDDPGSTPRMAAAVADRVPQGEWCAVPGARHLLPLERPDVLVAAVLAQIEGRPFNLPGALAP
ncbi:alpha/beta fold hydrolase [Saccharopolyspora spinosa]|uniref:Pimeloyl-ACP methyl ester carboxylesterase n=1 Tax=Saccharopolyspora spinosa TaxID=60894 RepID=A0A2N3Y095_SACSN|nr:alpha/beta hydrolase [Saccharopolyspora spinosa]PKW16271.1 pimeloyl-ACP methyl ester carboxylesterase [Saccharopolyspora spinosa]